MYLSEETIKALDKKLKELNKIRPLPTSVVKKIKEQFEIEMTYNSNAIEGNSLTLKETFWVISEGITIKNKPLKDHLEAKDHMETLEFLYEVIENNKNYTISEKLIKELHSLVVKGSQKDIAGTYRTGDVMIFGAEHKPPTSIKIPGEMKALMKWWKNTSNKFHIVELAALLHHKFVNIHPFWDGNGRTGRLLMNVLILSEGYPLAIILKNDRKRYYRTLSLADKGEYRQICEFVAQAVLRSLDVYLRAIKPTSEPNEKLISIKELSVKSPYSDVYLRKLANSGKLKAYKQGRNWVSTKKNLKDYRDGLKK